MRKNWQYIRQNYIAEFDRTVRETDKLTIIMGNINIYFKKRMEQKKKIVKT